MEGRYNGTRINSPSIWTAIRGYTTLRSEGREEGRNEGRVGEVDGYFMKK
jgi:hypothetical protein